MVLLNMKEGPYIFAAICIGSIFVIVMYFWYNGWVELRINFQRMRSWKSLYLHLLRQPFANDPNVVRRNSFMMDGVFEHCEEEISKEELCRAQESLQRRSTGITNENQCESGDLSRASYINSTGHSVHAAV